MGYTNYWEQTKAFTDQEWKTVKDEYNYIKEVCSNIITDESKSSNEIIFNGKNDLSHETFILFKNPNQNPLYDMKVKRGEGGEGFNFCKTAEKPYDVAVWHMLFFAKNKTKALSEISRDR